MKFLDMSGLSTFWRAVKGSMVTSVCGKAPNASGNVSLSLSDVLPQVTQADNGATLVVRNGVWTVERPS